MFSSIVWSMPCNYDFVCLLFVWHPLSAHPDFLQLFHHIMSVQGISPTTCCGFRDTLHKMSLDWVYRVIIRGVRNSVVDINSYFSYHICTAGNVTQQFKLHRRGHHRCMQKRKGGPGEPGPWTAETFELRSSGQKASARTRIGRMGLWQRSWGRLQGLPGFDDTHVRGPIWRKCWHLAGTRRSRGCGGRGNDQAPSLGSRPGNPYTAASHQQSSSAPCAEACTGWRTYDPQL